MQLHPPSFCIAPGGPCWLRPILGLAEPLLLLVRVRWNVSWSCPAGLREGRGPVFDFACGVQALASVLGGGAISLDVAQVQALYRLACRRSLACFLYFPNLGVDYSRSTAGFRGVWLRKDEGAAPIEITKLSEGESRVCEVRSRKIAFQAHKVQQRA